MNYVGNYIDWIKKHEIINMLDSKEGDITPVWQPDRWGGNALLEKFKELARPGYSNNKIFFHQLNAKSIEMKDYSFVYPELPNKRKNKFWWFVKLLPGEMQTMHIDPHLVEVESPVRYTMFLQDWEPGHIFTYDNKMLSDYHAGDVYEWNDPMTLHGVVNIGYNTRYTLQITMHD